MKYIGRLSRTNIVMSKVSIAHFSDIHMCGIKNIPFWALFSKRLYGYVYWYVSRGKNMILVFYVN